MMFVPKMAMLLLGSVCLLSIGSTQALAPRVYTPLRTGSITPRGWLLTQLKLQAEGLSGHLSQFWDDIINTSWMGGSGDGGLHERTPYWLNGMVPLAYLLQNAGVEELPGVKGLFKDGSLPSVKPLEQVERYMNYILDNIDDSGWLGPAPAPLTGESYWGPNNMLLSLAQYAEANQADDALFHKISSAITNHLLLQQELMKTTPMTSWAAQRWQDMALAAQWVLLNDPQGNEADLKQLLVDLHDQGVDWEYWFETFAPENATTFAHNVNCAQGLKSAAILFVSTGNETLHKLSQNRMANMDAEYGLPTGMFNGDEILPSPATRNPSRGIELCGVVEAMYSYTTMFSVHGDVAFADRAEKIAYNALPATWASPRGGDMWAHQYLQAINEINAIDAEDHLWQHDGPLSETYGLEPNFGCCTANFNQGWPKFANMAIMASSDGGAAVAILAPLEAELADGSTVEIETSYPYGDEVLITCTAVNDMPLYIRIPSSAGKSTLNGEEVEAGTMAQVECLARGGKASTFMLAMHPEIRVEQWGDNTTDVPSAYSVLRGPLLYSLPIGTKFTQYGHHFGTGDMAANDYYVNPTTPWNVALDLDPSNPGKTLTFTSTGLPTGAAPFNHTGWPSVIEATAREVPSWGEYTNSAAAPPASPACTSSSACGAPTKVQLVPHGGTDLRMGELPLSGLFQ